MCERYPAAQDHSKFVSFRIVSLVVRGRIARREEVAADAGLRAHARALDAARDVDVAAVGKLLTPRVLDDPVVAVHRVNAIPHDGDAVVDALALDLGRLGWVVGWLGGRVVGVVVWVGGWAIGWIG